MVFDTGLYDQIPVHDHTMGQRRFMLTITSFTAIFIMVSMVGASFSYDWTFGGNLTLLLLFMVVCTLISIAGGLLAHANDDPLMSVLGGAICAAAMGMMIGPFVALFEVGSVVQAFTLAAVIVVVTGLIGALLPNDLSTWGAPLFGLLLGAIVIQFGGIFLAMFGFEMQLAFTVLDWAVLILFCGIMVYDLNMARRLDRTLDNAIDVAVSVFLNFANIFIRLLSIMGKSKN